MNYLSITFVAFVAILYGIYNIVPTRFRWYTLLLASIFFYLSFDARYILFLAFAAITTFISAKFLNNIKHKKLILGLCIVANVAVWFLIKGFSWWGTNLNRVLGIFELQVDIPIIFSIVPIGISYYVLQAIGYVVDVYRENIQPERNFGKYFLFLSYFPAIVQGPISKYEQLSGQLTAGKKIGYDVFRRKLLFILLGLTKKMVIADQIAVFANYCFLNYEQLSGSILYVGAVCYAIQLYMDFSGCVDICRGVSGLFGIELVDNFKAPYFSKSIKEFWRNWHISLSTWLKDYVYIPLGGGRSGTLRKYFNVVVTFFVSGIWHGEGFNYIVWGLLQAVYQIVGDVTLTLRSRIKKWIGVEKDSFSDKIYRVIITFNLTVFSWIFFRAGSLTTAVKYIGQMIRNFELGRLFDGSLYTYGISIQHSFVLFGNLCAITLIDYLSKKQNIDLGSRILNTHIVLRWIIYFLLLFNIILFGAYGSGYDMAGFLYGGF